MGFAPSCFRGFVYPTPCVCKTSPQSNFDSCRSPLKYPPGKHSLTFTEVTPFPVLIFHGYGTNHPKSEWLQNNTSVLFFPLPVMGAPGAPLGGLCLGSFMRLQSVGQGWSHLGGFLVRVWWLVLAVARVASGARLPEPRHVMPPSGQGPLTAWQLHSKLEK